MTKENLRKQIEGYEREGKKDLVLEYKANWKRYYGEDYPEQKENIKKSK